VALGGEAWDVSPYRPVCSVACTGGELPADRREGSLALEPGAALTEVPDPTGGTRPVLAPTNVDVVMGNPPYVRRQNIQQSQWTAIRRALGHYPAPRPQIHELSGLHTYFWVHGTRFLRPGGYLAFLSSSSWLENTSGVFEEQLVEIAM